MDSPVRQPVRVVVRVRPPHSASNDDEQGRVWVQPIDGQTIQTTNHRNLQETLQYQFEQVYGFEATQLEIFNTSVKSVLQHTLAGRNACVFAYGPTGSGKTHTILGTSTDPGIIPRCVKHLFADIGNRTDTDWTVSFSYLEIYNEKVRDLLTVDSSDLPIRQDQNRQIFVVGLTEKTIASVDEFNKAFAPASKNRRTAATLQNEHSSRSHSVLRLKVQGRQRIAPHRLVRGKLHLIDLAGCEDNRKTGNKGIRLKESSAINTSLFTLSQVVHALNRGQTCIPYRASKLTRLLQDSLGGDAHTCMVVTLSPEEIHYFETYTTLNFARSTKRIVNTVTTDVTTENIAPSKKRKAVENGGTKAKRKSASYLGPLLKQQVRLNKQVCRRLENLERRLLQQISHQQTTTTTGDTTQLSAGCDTTQQQQPDTTTSSWSDATFILDKQPTDDLTVIDSTDDTRVDRRHADDITAVADSTVDLFEKTPARLTAEDTVTTSQPELGSPVSTQEAAPVSSSSQADIDKVDSIIAQLHKRHATKTKDEDNPKVSRQAKLRKQDTTVSYSPLFQKPSLLRRRRNNAFCSTAAPPKPQDLDNDSTEDTAEEQPKDAANCTSVESAEFQKEHNDRILSLLNNGNMAELQKLQTLGVKRAQLVISWRQLNGPFNKFDDLKSVPGFNIKSFMKNNLIKI